MTQLKHISLILLTVLVSLTSCNDIDEKFDIEYATLKPSVNKTNIAVGEEIEIGFSSVEDYGFNFIITDGGDNIEVIEQDGVSYLKGIDEGTATILFENNIGTNEVSVTVGIAPSVDLGAIDIGDSVAISRSRFDQGFSVVSFDDHINISTKDSSVFYLYGLSEGTAEFTIKNNFGEETSQINVISTLEEEGNYYKDYQGIVYNIVAEDSKSEVTILEVANNYQDDLLPVDSVIIIPAEVYIDGKAYIVKGIDDNAFSKGGGAGNPSIKELYFAEGSKIDSIGSESFLGCENLELVDLTNCTELSSIGDKAFYQCTSLTDIIFPINIEMIGESAFEYCNSIVSLDLSNRTKLITIHDNCFSSCTSLESINFFNCTSLTSISDFILDGCTLLKTLNIKGCIAVVSIGEEAFSSCSSLETVNLNEFTSLQSIDKLAFRGCSSLQSVDLINCDELIYVGAEAFIACNSDLLIDLPGMRNEWSPNNYINKNNWSQEFTR